MVDDRLEFVLPDFSRHVWVSDGAREMWEPRMGRIRAAMQDVTLQSVTSGIRGCGLILARGTELQAVLARYGDRDMTILPLEPGPPPPTTQAVTVSYALGALIRGPQPSGAAGAFVGSPATVRSIASAWDRGVCGDVAELLGYPPCCGSFLSGLANQERRLDATWAVARNSGTCGDDSFHISLHAAPETNLLWAPLGISPLPHVPCSFHCAASKQAGWEVMERGRALGYETEMRWLREMTSWPMQWSALHGIAEVKTPVLKMVARTDATAAKYTLLWEGTVQTDLGMPGLRFPHKPPRRLRISDSSSFRRGLANTENNSTGNSPAY